MIKTNQQKSPNPAEIELEEHMLTIKLEALKCHGMLKHPSIYDVNDLVQEGIITFYKAYKEYNETKSASFPTYFLRCLINDLNCILIKSYGRPYVDKTPNLPSLFVEMDDTIYNNTPGKINTPVSICNMIFKLAELSGPAKQYIIFCLDIPKNAQAKIVKNSRLKFEIVREHLEMTWEEEFEVRKEITTVLESVD